LKAHSLFIFFVGSEQNPQEEFMGILVRSQGKGAKKAGQGFPSSAMRRNLGRELGAVDRAEDIG
jgi:hypothetical protein